MFVTIKELLHSLNKKKRKPKTVFKILDFRTLVCTVDMYLYNRKFSPNVWSKYDLYWCQSFHKPKLNIENISY